MSGLMLQMRGRVLGEYEVEPVEGARCFELPMEDELFVVSVRRVRGTPEATGPRPSLVVIERLLAVTCARVMQGK